MQSGKSLGLSLRRKSKTRSLSVENDILALQEDVSEDGELHAQVVLDTTKAGVRAVGHGGVVDVLAWNDSLVAVDVDGEVGEVRVTGEGPAAYQDVVNGTGHLEVVLNDDEGVDHDEGGTGICMYQSE